MIQPTSQRAFASIQAVLPSIEERLLEAFSVFKRIGGGLGATEAAAFANINVVTARAAINKLVRDGLLRNSGRRCKTPSGRAQIEWEML